MAYQEFIYLYIKRRPKTLGLISFLTLKGNSVNVKLLSCDFQ